MISRAGGYGEKDPFAAPGESTNLALNSPDNIEKEREFERMHKQLKKQFEAMDQSGDGSLSKEELVNFLFDKVKGQMSPSK